jgi:hypothetical protein
VEVISSAQRFDYGKDGMGKDIEDDASETGEANYYEDGKHVTGKNVEDDTSEANKADYAFEDIIEEEDDHPLPIFEALYLKAAVDDIDAATNEKALESTNGMACYSSLNMVTGVKVEKYMRLGKIHSTTRSPGRCGSREQDEEANEEMTARKNLVVKAILCLVRESFTTFRIMDGRDENVDDYEIARDYRIPKKFLKAKGWARRPRKGEMYGTKYIERFKAELFEFFKISSRDSDKKLGPAIILERLQLAHPDLYTLPSFAEIQSFVSQCFNREKDGNSEEPIPNSTSRRRCHRGNGVVEANPNEETLEEAIATIVDYYGGNILPKYVLLRLRDQFSTALVDSQKANLTKLITKKRSEVMKEKLRMLIG